MSKQYQVTFAQGAPQEVTYPVEAESRQQAKEEFSRQYLGRVDSTLCSLLKVTKDEQYEECAKPRHQPVARTAAFTEVDW